MSNLELPVQRTALLLVELQNDIVPKTNSGKKGFRGVPVSIRNMMPLLATVASSGAVRAALGASPP